MIPTILIFGPDIQVGPLTGLLFWVVAALIILALLGGFTVGGMVVFVLFWLVVAIVAYFIVQRLFRRAGGA